MNEMRVASMAFAAYLVSSADLMSITIRRSWLRWNGAYIWRIMRYGLFIFRADDDAIRTVEVVDGRTFLEELGIGDDAERSLHSAFVQFFLHGLLDLVSGADRHGGFVHDDFVFGHVLGDGACSGSDILQVGGAVFVGRCTDGDHLHQTVRHAGGDIGGETQAARFDVALDDFIQTRFVDGHAAALQQGDLLRIDIQAQHVVAQISQTCA